MNFIKSIALRIQDNAATGLAVLLTYPIGKLLHDLGLLFWNSVLPQLSPQLTRDILSSTIAIMLLLCAYIFYFRYQFKKQFTQLQITLSEKNQEIHSLTETIKTLKTSSTDDKSFIPDAGVWVNKTKKILECPRCSNPITIHQDPQLSNSRSVPYFACTDGDYIFRPQDRFSNYLDAYKIRDELLRNI